MSRSLMLLLAGASGIALASAAMAQTEQGVIVLDAITIYADDNASGTATGYVARVNQMGTKTDTPMLETQQSVTVVTNKQIRDQGATTLGQALNYSAGIVGQPYGLDPRFDGPIIRGLGADEAQYLNGLRMVRSFGAPTIETYGLEQIEVLRGPSSALFGANSPAGVINQVQKRAQFDDFNEVGLGFGSNDNAQVFFDLNRAPSDNFAWRLTGIGKDGATQIDEITDTRGYLAAALRWQVDDATLIDFLASYQKDGPKTPPGLSYAATQLGDPEDLRDFYAGETGFDDSDRRMTNIGMEIRHEFDNGWQLTQGFRYQDVDWEYEGVQTQQSGDPNTPYLIPRNAISQVEDATTINLDTRLSGTVTSGAAEHRLLFGLEVRQWDGYASTDFITFDPLDLRNPVHGLPDNMTPWYTGVKDLVQTQVGIYAQDEVSVGNWRGSLALRHDWSKQTGTSYTNYEGESSAYRKDSATTGRVGLSHVFDNGIAPYVSYSTSFLPQIGQNTGADSDGNAFKPTETEQWEVGVKYEPTGFDGFFTISLYDLKQKNAISSKTISLGQDMDGDGVEDTRIDTYQVGKVKSRGLELEATAELAESWSIRGGYAYNETEIVGGDFNGNEVGNAPEHSASLWLDHDFGNGFRAGGGVRYIGSRFGEDANNYKMDAVTLVDLGASYTRNNVEASVNLTNVTDEAYLASCTAFSCFYGEGRAVNARVSYKW